MNKEKALGRDSHRTHTISHTTESLKENLWDSYIFVEFFKVKGRAAASFFLSCWLQSNAWWKCSVEPKPEQPLFHSDIDLMKANFCTAPLSGTHGTNHCPRETLHLLYSMRISRHSLLQTSALYSFCNTAAMLNIRLTVKPSDSVLNSWVPFWTKSSSFLKD